MGCTSSVPAAPVETKVQEEVQSYLKPFKRFNLSFSANPPNEAAMKRMQDYAAWTNFLKKTMEDALRSEWESEYGMSLSLNHDIPCHGLEIHLIKARRGYKGSIQWTSLDCKTSYVAEYIVYCITTLPNNTDNLLRSINISPEDIWTEPEDDIIEDPVDPNEKIEQSPIDE
jgi:hypothetical protein